MKTTIKILFAFVLICMLSTAVCGCNVPRPFSKPEPTEAVQPEEPEEEQLIENNSADESSNDEEDIPMIVNPGHTSLPAVKTASFTVPGSAPVRNAQIVRPGTSTGNDETLTIKNDHTVTYPENQQVIQKSVPSGQLQPLGYIQPTYLASGQSISFAPGATSAVISGYVPAGGVVSYNLYAFANQNFLVLLTSDTGSAVLSVSDVYGTVYLDPNNRQTSYNMYLPKTATYYVNIYSSRYGENFTLQIFIPARVQIPAGRTSAVMSGTLAPYSVVSYTAYMYAGQTARIDDYSGARPTSFLRVSGLQSGVVYMDYTAYMPSWYAVVPQSQDYLIEVISMDQSSNYRLTVDVR